MKTILIDPFYTIGHINSILKTAILLQEYGYRVVFIGLEYSCKPAIETGFEFISYYPSFELINGNKSRVTFGERINNLITKSRLKELRTYIRDYSKIINDLSPDLIIVDEEHSILKHFLCNTIKVPVICFQTMPDKSPGKFIPPFTSWYCPKFEDRRTAFLTQILWLRKIFFQQVRRNVLSIKYLGQDSISLTIKILKENNLRLSDFVSFESSHKLRIKDRPLLVLSAIDFDFPRENRSGIYRVGPIKEIKQTESNLSPRFQALLTKIVALKKKEKRMIIYCSLGTVTFDFESRLNLFFKKIMRVAISNPKLEFICSVGDFFKPEVLHPLPNNVSIYRNLPQVDLLQKCDFMITHGGMNSITECVFCGVPMLVYPLSRKWDQPGNSARVVYHGLGLRGRIESDSAKTISKKINQLIENYQYYKDNVLRMKQKFEEKNNSTEVVNIIESIINSHE